MNEQGVEVYAGDGGPPYQLLASLPPGTVQWEETGLAPGTQYARYVAAANAGGTVTSGPGTQSTSPVPPGAAATAFQDETASSLTVNWSSGGNGAGTLYRLEASVDPGFGTLSAFTETTSLSGVLAGLAPNTVHHAPHIPVTPSLI